MIWTKTASKKRNKRKKKMWWKHEKTIAYPHCNHFSWQRKCLLLTYHCHHHRPIETFLLKRFRCWFASQIRTRSLDYWLRKCTRWIINVAVVCTIENDLRQTLLRANEVHSKENQKNICTNFRTTHFSHALSVSLLILSWLICQFE